MMRTPGRWMVVIIGVAALALLLLGCTPLAAGGDGVGPQAWIDAPQHSSTHPMAPLEIVLHASDPGGVAMVEVSVGDALLVRRPPDDTDTPLTTFRVDWDPQNAGETIISARALNHSGVWSDTTSSTVTLVGPAAFNRLPAVQQPPPSTPRAQPTVSRPTRTPLPRLVPTNTLAAACTDQAKFIADVNFPDDTQVSPGQALTKVWRLRNDGTCSWNEAYKIVFVGGDALSNNTPLSIPWAVAPGANVDLAVDMFAPTSPGTYRGEYQIRNPQGVHFGVGASGQTPFYVQIVVAQSAPPPRPTSPPAPDTQPPSVSASHSPSGGSLPTGSTITFTANASDNLGVARIDLWVTAPGGWLTLVQTCTNTSTCSFTGGPYTTQGNLTYSAVAADAAGNETTSNQGSILFYVVVSQLVRSPL